MNASAAAPPQARRIICVLAVLVALAGIARAQQPASWSAPQVPFRIHGTTFYVGTRGLSSVLITSAQGHVLIDGALPESAAAIAANIRALGFRVEDVRLILNSHVHFDHAGGIAELRRLSGAKVAASAPSARVFESGRSGPDDPQYGAVPPIGTVQTVQVVKDGETLRVGDIAVTARLTPGHTPGGTSWTWRSCEDGRCADMVYADSVTAVSASGFQFTRAPQWPTVLTEFEKTFATIAALPCDILITPHPEASDLYGRLEKRNAGAADAMFDRTACRRYAEAGRERYAARIAEERAK